VRARLVVGADGRGSSVARFARIPGRVRPHGRIFHFAYWQGLQTETTDIVAWNLDPDGGALFPNEDGLTVLVTSATRDRLPEFRADPRRAYLREIASWPRAPDLSGAEQVSKLLGKLDMPNVMRPAARPGIAFVGDAALASDPLMGVGCGWAFQSAEWLAGETAPALLGDGDLDSALDRYRRVFRERVGLHHLLIAEYATGRKTYGFERAFFRAAAQDPELIRAIAAVTSRSRSPLYLLDPRVTARVLRTSAGLSGSRRGSKSLGWARLDAADEREPDRI